MVPRSLVNPAFDPALVAAPDTGAAAFHASLDVYEATPVHDLSVLAAEVGAGAVVLKDESDRMGLPAFKVLGASWAAERALAARPRTHTLVAASAGNHGRAVAHEAARRGLAARVYLPARASWHRREAIEAEGAEVVVTDGAYEQAVALAARDGEREGFLELADVGDSDPARWVIEGYATLFAELPVSDFLIVPIGVGSLGAAAARFGAATGTIVVGVEPVTAGCLTASLAAGEPTTVATPGTAMAGMDCAEVSAAAWPDLSSGIRGTVTVSDAEVEAAMRELASAGLPLGECSAAAVAALRALGADPRCEPLREAVGLGPASRVALIATEGPTDPEAWERAVGYPPAGFASP